jgi:hypothetical protein
MPPRFACGRRACKYRSFLHLPERDTQNLQPDTSVLCYRSVDMYSFSKSIQKADQTRRYSIQSTPVGWEVREEQDSRVVRQNWYQDWHRVERAQRAIFLTLSSLREQGWREV